jgi:WD40 repeat protein
MSISPCGGYLASGSADGCVYIWSTNVTISSTKVAKPTSKQNTATPVPVIQAPYTPVAKLNGHNQEVTSVDWTHDAENLMVNFDLKNLFP